MDWESILCGPVVRAGDIGDPVREIEYEPMPETEPIPEVVPEPLTAPAEPAREPVPV